MDNKTLSLTIDPRIIGHLGEALIENEKIALLELIKNTSDADANRCSITIDTYYESKHGQGRIVIEDDGNGMTPYIIENAFLKIASSYKRDHQKISPRFGRQAQGNKGIGRLALNQLGNFVSVKTKVYDTVNEFTDLPKYLSSIGYDNAGDLVNENKGIYYSFVVDWKRFEESDKIEQVGIELEKQIFHNSIFEHNKNHGTRIEVLGLKGIDFWRKAQTQKELEQDILAFINPFLDKKANFFVKIELDNETIRSDTYDIQYLEDNCFSKAEFNFNELENELNICIYRSKRYINLKVESLVKLMEKVGFKKVGRIPYDDLYDKYCSNKYTINLSSKKIISRDAPYADLEKFATYYSLDGETRIYLPGSFSGIIYGYDLSSGFNASLTAKVKDVIKNISGVKLYRNSFRIFPYGTKDNDWLGMSAYSLRQSSIIYKPHSSTGFINIDGEKNLERLKELTNRQGLVLDHYGSNFISLLREVVFRTIAKHDSEFTKSLAYPGSKIKKTDAGGIIEVVGILFKKDISPTKVSQIHAADLKDNYDKYDDEKKKKLITSLASYTKDIDNELAQTEARVKQDEAYIEEFYPIFGATLISEFLSHELIRLSNSIKIYTDTARQAAYKDRKNEVLESLSRIATSNRFLLRYASLLDTNSTSRRRKYKMVELKPFLENFVTNHPLLEDDRIKIKTHVTGDGYTARIVEESFRIIIENFLINSKYWLRKAEVSNPEITFTLERETNKLYVYDNGVGIFKDKEDFIFDAFVTNKPGNEGRGLGLYIVKNLLEEIGADITLSQERNEEGNRFKFIITFPDVEAL